MAESPFSDVSFDENGSSINQNYSPKLIEGKGRPKRRMRLTLKVQQRGKANTVCADRNFSKDVIVKCCQTGNLHVVKVSDVLREDLEPLQAGDLVAGSRLMMELDNKMYPVTFIKVKPLTKIGVKRRQSSKGMRPANKHRKRSSKEIPPKEERMKLGDDSDEVLEKSPKHVMQISQKSSASVVQKMEQVDCEVLDKSPKHVMQISKISSSSVLQKMEQVDCEVLEKSPKHVMQISQKSSSSVVQEMTQADGEATTSDVAELPIVLKSPEVKTAEETYSGSKSSVELKNDRVLEKSPKHVMQIPKKSSSSVVQEKMQADSEATTSDVEELPVVLKSPGVKTAEEVDDDDNYDDWDPDDNKVIDLLDTDGDKSIGNDKVLKLLMQKMSQVEHKLDTLGQKLNLLVEGKQATERDDNKENTNLLYNGLDLRKANALNGPYSYGLNLMDVLFDKEEMSTSLLFKPSSTKSSKSGLNEEKVQKLFELIAEKFKDNEFYKKEWNMKLFINKANQKCRDAARVLKKRIDNDSV